MNPPKLGLIAHQVVVAFILPEGSVLAQDAIRLMGREPFERPEPLAGRNMRRHQQMDMIRHYREGVQFVSMKPSFAIVEGVDHHLCNFMLLKKHRTIGGSV